MKNEISIEISLSNYDEVIKQLETIKKLLQDIADINVQIEVKN